MCFLLFMFFFLSHKQFCFLPRASSVLSSKCPFVPIFSPLSLLNLKCKFHVSHTFKKLPSFLFYSKKYFIFFLKEKKKRKLHNLKKDSYVNMGWEMPVTFIKEPKGKGFSFGEVKKKSLSQKCWCGFQTWKFIDAFLWKIYLSVLSWHKNSLKNCQFNF